MQAASSVSVLILTPVSGIYEIITYEGGVPPGDSGHSRKQVSVILSGKRKKGEEGKDVQI